MRPPPPTSVVPPPAARSPTTAAVYQHLEELRHLRGRGPLPSPEALASLLRPAAGAFGAALSACSFDVPQLVEALGGEFTGPHLDPARLARAFHPADVAPLLPEARSGIVPPIAYAPTNLAARLRQGNLSSAAEHPEAIWERVVNDVLDGRALVLPASHAARLPLLRPSPVGAVTRTSEGATKVRVIHHLSKSGRLADGSPDWSVNDLTDVFQVPPCDIGEVFKRILRRAYLLRQQYPKAHLVAAKVDVADAFRQLKIDPRYAPLFSYPLGEDLVVIDLRLGFGWAGSPGFFYRWATKLVERLKTMRPADVTPAMRESVAFLLDSIDVEQPDLHPISSLPEDEEALAAAASALADPDSPFWAEAFLDDSTMLEVNDGVRPLACSAACLWLHHEMYGWPREGAPPCIRESKLTSWLSVLPVLGVLLDLNKMEISLTEEKAERLRLLLHESFPRERATATVSEICQLIGYLRCYSYCVRPGRYFLWRLIEPMRGFFDRPHATVGLSDEFHEDLDAWREIAQQPHLMLNNFASPVHNHVRRPPSLLAVSDACGTAGGGVVAPAGLWWQVVWPAPIQERFARTEARTASSEEMITIAHLELASLLLGVAVLVEWAKERGHPLAGQALLALADNTNAVHWIRKAGARDRKAAAMVRALGVEEARLGFSCLAEYLPGKANITADYISRHSLPESQAFVDQTPCPLRHVPVSWVQVTPPSHWLERVLTWLSSTTNSRR